MISKFYELSRASESSFQRLIQVSKQNTKRNKWNERFSKNSLLGCEHNIKETSLKDTPNASEIDSNKDTVSRIENHIDKPNAADTGCVSPKTYENYKETLESNPLNIIYILEENNNDDNILMGLASNLSDTHVEKICLHVFESNLEASLTEKFILTFLPSYFRRQNTWLSVDILTKVYRRYSIQFELLLNSIIQDTEVHISILQEFITTLNNNEQTELLKCLFNLDISTDVFVRYIFSVYSLYKNCLKDEKIQNSILTYLIDASDKFLNDKQYGRLLLTFLQNKNSCEKLDVLQNIVDSHQSAFKRPCLNALNEVIKKCGV